MRIKLGTIRFVFILALCAVCAGIGATPAMAMDKKVKLFCKTGGYGAAAGFVAGGATAAMGMGDYHNALIGASLGLYAGILLGAYVVATVDEGRAMHGPNGSPGKKVGPDDWQEVPEDETDELIQRKDDRTGLQKRDAQGQQLAVWIPVVTLSF